jgi:hypothetical protein
MSSGTLPSGFINDTPHTIQGAGYFRAPIINNSTIIAENGWLSVYERISGNGTIMVNDTGTLSLQSNIQTGKFVMSKDAVLSGNGYTMELNGDFSFSQFNEGNWSGHPPDLVFKGNGAVERLEVGGEDFGLKYNGFVSNFHLNSLTVDGKGTWLSLADNIDNGNRHSPEVLYVEKLKVLDGATLNLNGIYLYTYGSDGKPYRVHAGDTLFGAGSILDQPDSSPTKLSVAVSGGGGGCAVYSSPAGITCDAGNTGGCKISFPYATSVALTALPDSNSLFAAWSGDGTTDASGKRHVTMDADRNVTASFTYVQPVRIFSTLAPYPTIHDACAAMTTGGTIQAREFELTEDLTLNKVMAINLKGGYNPAFSTNSGKYTTIYGKVTILGGPLTVEQLEIR